MSDFPWWGIFEILEIFKDKKDINEDNHKKKKGSYLHTFVCILVILFLGWSIYNDIYNKKNNDSVEVAVPPEELLNIENQDIVENPYTYRWKEEFSSPYEIKVK